MSLDELGQVVHWASLSRGGFKAVAVDEAEQSSLPFMYLDGSVDPATLDRIEWAKIKSVARAVEKSTRVYGQVGQSCDAYVHF